MSTERVEFARMGNVRIVWRPEEDWPLIAVEAIDPARENSGPYEFIHSASRETQEAARSYARRAYGARFDTPASVTMLDMAAWARGVAEAKRLFDAAIAKQPQYPFAFRLNHYNVVMYALPQGLLFASERRFARVDWKTFDSLEQFSPGSAYVSLRTILPGQKFIDRDTFYEFVRRFRW